MSITATYNRSYVYTADLSFSASASITSSLAIPWNEALGTAKPGTLTTRTDANTGVVTLTGGHGLTTGLIDVYWSTGSRYLMDGTVATNALTIDGGGGDDLPAADTAVTCITPSLLAVVVTGDDVVAFGVNCPAGGRVVFTQSGGTVIYAVPERTVAAPTYVWIESDGGTNPLASGSVGKVYVSHGSTSLTPTMSGLVQFD